MQFVQSRFLSQLLVMVLFWPEGIWKVVYPTHRAGRLPESLGFPLCVLHNPLFFLPITSPTVFQWHALCLLSIASFIWGELGKGWIKLILVFWYSYWRAHKASILVNVSNLSFFEWSCWINQVALPVEKVSGLDLLAFWVLVSWSLAPYLQVCLRQGSLCFSSLHRC